MADKETFKKWFDEGIEKEATHMIIVYNMPDQETCPVFVSAHRSAQKKAEAYDAMNNQRVTEVYSLSIDFDEQYRENPCFNFD
ncbi:MAG: hypothetical protein R3346_04145 [Candidatus Spechtbacterales bacterium]|nr:hypothetical protein [Candidatus Spechtbacterales bacterium]